MNDDDPTTKQTLETVIEMLKSLQADSIEIKGSFTNLEARVSSIESNITEIKLEQSRQAKQLDKMAMDQHSFASDLYHLRLEFREFSELRDAFMNALSHLAIQK